MFFLSYSDSRKDLNSFLSFNVIGLILNKFKQIDLH